MNFKNKFFINILCISCMTWSCEDRSDCELEQSFDKIQVRFYSKENLEETKFKFDLIKAEGTDSIFFESDSLSLYSLGLNPSSNNVVYLFSAGLDVFTLDINYDSHVSVISERCGPDIEYNLLSVINTTFDSVVLINTIVDVSINHNIEVYR